MKDKKLLSQLRRDPVSGDWVIISSGRIFRPQQFKVKDAKEKIAPKSGCPFEDPQKFGNEIPKLMLGRGGEELDFNDASKPLWFLQAVPNKFPILSGDDCSIRNHHGVKIWRKGAGSHEIIIYRDHDRGPSEFTPEEMETMIHGFQKRYKALANLDCAEYILIFHNKGKEAGASIYHPHSQILAMPVIPPDVARSIRGSSEYYRKNKRCVHCDMIRAERKEKIRIVYENKQMIVVAPFVSKVAFETRIFPKRHENAFEKIDRSQRRNLADAMRVILRKIEKGLNKSSYNFFIHTSPKDSDKFRHYHWHIEILPRTSIWAGVELGVGIDVLTVPPEKAADYLKKVK